MSYHFRAIALVTAVTLSCSAFACSDAADDDGSGGQGGGDASNTGGSTTSSGGSPSGGSDNVGGGGGEGGSGSVAEEWLGATPHADLIGEIAGQDVTIDPSSEDAANLGVLYCERNYVVPDVDDTASYGDGELQKIEIKFNFFFQGVEAEFQMEVEQEDLPGKVGTTLTVGSGVGETAVAVGIQPLDGDDYEYEDAGVSGTVVLELVSGTPGADGLIVPDQTGAFGAYVDVELESGGFIRGSFTANCADNDIETEIPE